MGEQQYFTSDMALACGVTVERVRQLVDSGKVPQVAMPIVGTKNIRTWNVDRFMAFVAWFEARPSRKALRSPSKVAGS